MAPNLDLVYSSQGGRSYLGEGWSLTISYIERSTKFGVPTYDYSIDQFDYHDENGAVHHLVPVMQQGDYVYYRYMSESEFSWFKYNKETEIWTVLKKNGRRLNFAWPFRIDRLESPLSQKRIFAWYLSDETDTTGNRVYYYYFPSYIGQDYVAGPVPMHIVYTSNINKRGQTGWKPAVKVVFTHSKNPDPKILECRIGKCAQQDYRQLDRVEVSVINDAGDYTVRKRIDLQYDTVDHHKVLSQIKPSAADDNGNWTTLPPISFSYAPSSPDSSYKVDTSYDDPQDKVCFIRPVSTVGRNWQTKTTRNEFLSPLLSASITSVDETLIDMNGDSIKDYVIGRVGGYEVYLGQFNSSNQALEFAPHTEWKIPELFECDPNPNRDEACPIRTTATRSLEYNYLGWVRMFNMEFPPELDYWGTTEITQDLIDLNGDGLPDWIRKNCGFDDCWLTVHYNNGSGFDKFTHWDLPIPFFSLRGEAGSGYHGVPLGGLRLTLVALVDLSGDGLPDLVSSFPYPEHKYLHVYLNTGSSFSQDPIPWSSPWGTIELQGEFRLGADRNGGIIELADMNGDGLPDLVEQAGYKDPPHPYNLDGVDMEPIQVYLNVGDGFEANPRSWELRRPLSFVRTVNAYPGSTKVRDHFSDAQLIDLNNDGLTDYLQYDLENGRWLFFANEGDRFASDSIPIDADVFWKERSVGIEFSTLHSSYGKILDINGDGRLDLIAPYFDDRSDYPSDYNCLALKLGEYTPGVKLVRVENGYGGWVDIEYAPSSVTEQTHLPAPIQVVRSISTHDAFGETAQIGHKVDFSYEGGLLDTSEEEYFHPANKEFRGFASVNETDFDRNLLVERRYHQDAYKNGYLDGENHSRLSTGNLIYSTTISYDREEPENSHPIGNSPKVWFYYPETIEKTICNEEPECTPTLIYQEFDSDGNLTLRRDFGISRKNGQPVPEDDRRFVWGYKKKIDLANNIYIFATGFEAQMSWSESDDIWVPDGLTSYYHDGSRSRDFISQGLLTSIRSNYATDNYYESARSYDTESGLLLSETDFNGNETTYTYDPLTNSYIATKVKGGLKEEFDWDIATGQKVRYRDPNNVLWYYDYDGFGRLVEEGWIPPAPLPEVRPSPVLQRSISYYDWEYDNRHSPTYVEELSVVDHQEKLYAQRWTYYNGMGDKVQEVENHNGVHHISRYFGYDLTGRLHRVSVPVSKYTMGYKAPDWNYTDHSLILYDPLDRVTEIRRPCNSGNARTFSFGGDLTITMIDEEENKISTLQDTRGNIIEVDWYQYIHHPSGEGGAYTPIRKNIFAYNGDDNIIKATDHLGNEINYERDLLGRITSVRLSGFPEGKAWTFDYDGNGNLTHSLTPAGREINYAYDELDRLVGREFKINGVPDGSVEYQYDGTTSYGKGRLTGARSAGGTAEYFYDPRGNVIEYRTKNGVSGEEYELAFTYNEDNQIKTITYPDGSVFRYTYNPDGTAKTLVRESNKNVIAEAAYNARRQVNSIATDTGIQYSYSYDRCGRPTEIQSTSGNGEIMDRSISYYTNDKIRTIHDTEEIRASGQPLQLQYDAMLRLKSATGQAYDANYEYDQADRLIQMDQDGKSVEYVYEDTRFPWAVTSINGNSGIIDYSYDDDGIIKSEVTRFAKTTDFTFNARGLIKSVKTSTGSGFLSGGIDWEYDHLDRPIHASYSGPCLPPGCSSTDYVDKYYENQWVQPMLDRTTKFLFFAGRRLASFVKEPFPEGTAVPETLYYFHADQVGSIRYVTDATGEVVDTHYYYPYGEEYHTSSSTEVDFGFNDRKNVGYGLYRFPMRMYSPSAHQWVSLDPSMLTDPTILVLNGVNPMAYAGNDPINHTDVLGLRWYDAHRTGTNMLKLYTIESLLDRGYRLVPSGSSWADEVWVHSTSGRRIDIFYTETTSAKTPARINIPLDPIVEYGPIVRQQDNAVGIKRSDSPIYEISLDSRAIEYKSGVMEVSGTDWEYGEGIVTLIPIRGTEYYNLYLESGEILKDSEGNPILFESVEDDAYFFREVIDD